MSDDIPNLSSFDPAIPYSDIYPPEIFEEEDPAHLLEEAEYCEKEGIVGTDEDKQHYDDFDDELEALELVKQEQKEKWDKEGIVIRGSTLSKQSLGVQIAADNRRRKVRRERNKPRLTPRASEVRSSSLPPGTQQIHRHRRRSSGCSLIGRA
ncbi:hypothetical protein BDZ91DRAFT_370048 [Kalaharituber pfeilii]|nr:hypothetical protein BDZ91DRAFT_370048 [Kalaharituber pfeilii]